MDIRAFFRLSILFLCCLTPLSFADDIRCWVNEKGARACGNLTPAEQIRRGYWTVSRQGTVKKEVEREKTEEELKERERLTAIEHEKERRKAEQIRQDKALLDTFSSLQDIARTRDAKISAIKNSIRLAEKRNERVQADLNKYRKIAAGDKKNIEQINLLKQRIENNEQYIARKRSEQERIEEDYAQKMVRFKELRSGG